MVVADVYGPNPPYKTTVRLHEGGIAFTDPDLRKNDGTYSGYFVQFTGKGRYVVTVHVSGDERTRLGDPWRHYYPTNVIVESPDKSNANKSKTTRPVSRFKSVDLPDEMPNQAGKPTGAFQRVVYVGSFEVTENIVQSDVPPGNIWNFKAVEKRPGANDTVEVKFSWTWPGAHMTFGTASAVDIRASNDAAKLKKEFEKQKRMTEADVVEGNLDPLPAGSKHEVTLVFSSEWAERVPSGALWWMIFLAARVVNSDGLNSYRFTVIRVLYLTPPVMTTVPLTPRWLQRRRQQRHQTQQKQPHVDRRTCGCGS
ncbi:calcium-activated chloride channel regulator 2-like [Rhipicephalus microplus]|uniref:calcium-activated chloride channel regulator 2-like n=1 Tax=Rhipicephalus microplus TaxID=6941 RepID=UPI003F6D06B6